MNDMWRVGWPSLVAILMLFTSRRGGGRMASDPHHLIRDLTGTSR